jgi:hypothetical protein
MWLSVDPLAHKYPNLSPYAFTGNNPVMLVDPDGRKIWIVGEDGTRIEYEAGMKYDGEDKFTEKMVEQFNSMGQTENGKAVVDVLVDSEANYDFTEQKSQEGTVGFIGNKDGAKGGTAYLGNSTDLEKVAHETFHGYQQELGQGGASIFNEVEAYLFGKSVAMQYSFNSGEATSPSSSGLGTKSETGRNFERAFFSLLWNDFNQSQFNSAIRNFKNGSMSNETGIYDSYPLRRSNQNQSLIKSFYPLIR